MIRKIQRRWFEVWGDEEAQNRILKYLLLLFAVMAMCELILVAALAFKRPLVVSVESDTTRTIEQREPSENLLQRELTRAIQNYLRTRHNWEPGTIEAHTRSALLYIAPEFREKFLVNTQEQIRIAKEKQVAQRLFADAPTIDLAAKKATVHAERILIVNGIRAAQGLSLEIGFSLGERTVHNPEGVFITSEKLETTN